MVSFNHFNTKTTFETLLNKGEIDESQICFIKDTKEIYTHGLFYPCPYTETELLNLLDTKVNSEEVLKKGWTELKVDNLVDLNYSNVNPTNISLKSGGDWSKTGIPTPGYYLILTPEGDNTESYNVKATIISVDEKRLYNAVRYNCVAVINSSLDYDNNDTTLSTKILTFTITTNKVSSIENWKVFKLEDLVTKLELSKVTLRNYVEIEVEKLSDLIGENIAFLNKLFYGNWTKPWVGNFVRLINKQGSYYDLVIIDSSESSFNAYGNCDDGPIVLECSTTTNDQGELDFDEIMVADNSSVDYGELSLYVAEDNFDSNTFTIDNYYFSSKWEHNSQPRIGYKVTIYLNHDVNSKYTGVITSIQDLGDEIFCDVDFGSFFGDAAKYYLYFTKDPDDTYTFLEIQKADIPSLITVGTANRYVFKLDNSNDSCNSNLEQLSLISQKQGINSDLLLVFARATIANKYRLGVLELYNTPTLTFNDRWGIDIYTINKNTGETTKIISQPYGAINPDFVLYADPQLTSSVPSNYIYSDYNITLNTGILLNLNANFLVKENTAYPVLVLIQGINGKLFGFYYNNTLSVCGPDYFGKFNMVTDSNGIWWKNLGGIEVTNSSANSIIFIDTDNVVYNMPILKKYE